MALFFLQTVEVTVKTVTVPQGMTTEKVLGIETVTEIVTATDMVKGVATEEKTDGIVTEGLEITMPMTTRDVKTIDVGSIGAMKTTVQGIGKTPGDADVEDQEMVGHRKGDHQHQKGLCIFHNASEKLLVGMFMRQDTSSTRPCKPNKLACSTFLERTGPKFRLSSESLAFLPQFLFKPLVWV